MPNYITDNDGFVRQDFSQQYAGIQPLQIGNGMTNSQFLFEAAKRRSFGDGKMNLQNQAVNEWFGEQKQKASNFMQKNSNTMGSVGAGIAGAIGIGTATYENWKPRNVDKYDNQNSELQNNALSNMDSQYRYGSGSTEGLLGQVSTQQVNQVDPITGKVNFGDLRPSKGQQWANVGKSTMSGASAGMKIAGPWGALIGGAIGGISAGLGSLFGRKKAKREAERINNERIKSNYMANYSNSLNNKMNANALNNAVNNQRTENAMNQQANYHALGGFMDGPNNYNMMTNMFNTQALNSLNKTKFTSLPQESKVNTFADGGQFGTTPSYYPAKSSFGGSDISEINNGGTHEENKYNGVPLGIDSEGIPNLVEEGEVIWRGAGNRLIGKHLFADGGSVEQQEDYVFSNRLKPSQTLLNEVNIAVKQKDGKKKDQKSYADIAKEIYKEQKERPNDPITNNTINANLGKLKDAQEVDRAKEEAKQARKAMANGMNGMMGNGMNPAQNVNQMQDPSMIQQVPQEQQQEQPQDLSMYNRSGNEMIGQQYACGGKLHGNGDPIFRPEYDGHIGLPDGYRFNNTLTTEPQFQIGLNQYVPAFSLGDNKRFIGNDAGNRFINLSTPEKQSNLFTIPSNARTWVARSNPDYAVRWNPITDEYTQVNISNNNATRSDELPNPIADNTSTTRGPSTYSSSGEAVGGKTAFDIKDHTFEHNNRSTLDQTNSGFQKPTTIVNQTPANSKPRQDRGITNTDNRLDYVPRMTWMRYAPIVGSAMSFLSDRFNDGPDRTLLNRATADANRGTYLPVNPSPIGDYLQYNPFDINYATNKLNAQSQATRRGILNASNGNRATAMANMLGADWNAQIGLGELQKQSYDYNLGQEKIVGEFNKDTNKFNSTQDFEAQRANQQALASLKNYKMQSNLDAARLAYQMDIDDAQRRTLNATTFFNNVGELGRENLAYNQAMSNPALYYMSGKNGAIDYKALEQAMKKQDNKKTASKGGTIRRKKNNEDYLNNYSLSL